MVNNYSEYTKEVEDKLYQLSSGIEHQKKEKLKKYIGTQYDVYALDAKTQIEACKEGYSFYSDNHSATFDVFNAIYLSSKNFETINQAFYTLFASLSCKIFLKSFLILDFMISGA